MNERMKPKQRQNKTKKGELSPVPEFLNDALDLGLVCVNQIQQDFAEGVSHGLVVSLVKVDALKFTLGARSITVRIVTLSLVRLLYANHRGTDLSYNSQRAQILGLKVIDDVR